MITKEEHDRMKEHVNEILERATGLRPKLWAHIFESIKITCDDWEKAQDEKLIKVIAERDLLKARVRALEVQNGFWKMLAEKIEAENEQLNAKAAAMEKAMTGDCAYCKHLNDNSCYYSALCLNNTDAWQFDEERFAKL